ncbi:MAG: transposase [Candidatus Sulfotelmatobacter sp.]
MPWGLTRFQHRGQSHFITFCCYHRRCFLTSDDSRRIFESALERVRRKFLLQVYGYVVMPEHVHLLLSEPEKDALADALKSLKQGVSRRWRRGSFLAKAILRFQHSQLPAVCGKAALH